jgi:hypothetical protein
VSVLPALPRPTGLPGIRRQRPSDNKSEGLATSALPTARTWLVLPLSRILAEDTPCFVRRISPLEKP